ncbi:hypothetical protein ABZ883_05895 [Streptomyces sp. NPDC046977]|uniref:hypothetical protein n=1 Tax=Streptomyces sp. NPDC046977 TaxID=3154703 RepID=UPI0033DD8703
MRRLNGVRSDVLLPSALGNALRGGELTAGERYGLTTLTSWPRIYMSVSDRLMKSLESTRDALDTAVNLCHSMLAIALCCCGAFYDERTLWWLPVLALVLAAVAYKGAVIAAQAYSGLMHVVYDLHRFDLLAAMHHRLPSKTEERQVLAELSDFFMAGWGPEPHRLAERVVNWPYDHDRSRAKNTDRTAGPEDM